MRLVIVGAGAMGSIYAGRFSAVRNEATGDPEHEVWAVDPNRAHLDVIKHQGLSLEGPAGREVFQDIHVAASPEGVNGKADLVILATKANHVPAAALALGPVLSDNTLVLAMQNGLGAAERVIENLPKDAPRPQVALGVAQGFGASIEAPGEVKYANMRLMRFGETQDGESPRMEALAALWRQAGFEAQAFSTLSQLIWEKFICNVTLSGPCTVFEKSVGQMKAVPEQWQVALACGLEAFEVGRALGVKFSFDDAQAYIEAFADSVAGAKPSMLQDFEAGRRSEIDVINGRVEIEAAKAGMDAPWNRAVSAIVRGKEAAVMQGAK